MDIKYWTPVLVGTVLAIGSVQAMADSNWSYDESSQTIIGTFHGSPVNQSSSQHDVPENSDTWYYDEGMDTIVYNSNGSRSHFVQSSPSTPEPEFYYQLAFLDQ